MHWYFQISDGQSTLKNRMEWSTVAHPPRHLPPFCGLAFLNGLLIHPGTTRRLPRGIKITPKAAIATLINSKRQSPIENIRTLELDILRHSSQLIP